MGPSREEQFCGHVKVCRSRGRYLCAGWPVRRLLAHLVLREQTPFPQRRRFTTDSIRQRLRPTARMGYRRSPVGVEPALPDGRSRVVQKGDIVLQVNGERVELALPALGRRSAARIPVTGKPSAVAGFDAWAAS